MNKYIQAFLDDNNLKVGEMFKIKHYNANKFWFDDYGWLYSEKEENIGQIILMLLSGEVQVEKLSNIPSEKFFPKEGERYYFVTAGGKISYMDYSKDNCDVYLISHNLVFETREQVEDYKWFLDKIDEYKKPFIPHSDNYYLFYQHTAKRIMVFSTQILQYQGTIYFGDVININTFIKEVGEERIKKYMFDIWE